VDVTCIPTTCCGEIFEVHNVEIAHVTMTTSIYSRAVELGLKTRNGTCDQLSSTRTGRSERDKLDRGKAPAAISISAADEGRAAANPPAAVAAVDSLE